MEVINKFIDTESEPDLIADNVEVLYTDSARLQMKMTTPLLKQFTTASEQRDEFTEGIHVWFYENDGELNAEVTANWAKHDKITDIWEARSNVVLTKADGQMLETEQLFWDVKKAVVYSEKYTKYTDTKTGNISSGESFWAIQDFNEYKLSNITGIGRTVIYMRDEDENKD